MIITLQNFLKNKIKSFWKENGFTFMELAVVILVISVITGAVGISVQNVNSSVRLSNAAARALADIKELKEIAMNEGKTVSITVNPGSENYTLTVDGVSETVQFDDGDYKGVTITSTDFSGALSFTSTGEPRDGGSSYTGNRLIMNINDGAAQIEVYGNSGLVAVDIPSWGGGCGFGGC